MMVLILTSIIGIIDSSYLTYEHYSQKIPPCSNSIFVDCGKVLNSSYSVVFGVPLALIGIIFYSLVLLSSLSLIFSRKRFGAYALLILTTGGILGSAYFIYLQLVVIKSICLYCMASAFLSTVLFITAQIMFRTERRIIVLKCIELKYRYILKPVLFLINPEFVHNRMTFFGEVMGKSSVTQKIFSTVFEYKNPVLRQDIAGIEFRNPIGLAAGFDYEAKLTQILHAMGFGFQTVGTITNMPYEGNPKPLLGRLPQSKSLMVNKGFKNPGVKKIISKLSSRHFKIPVGISIGRTNTLDLKTQQESIADIIKAFTRIERSRIEHSYYELNISCPNLYGDITFYPPKNLKDLLDEIDKLHLKKPVFIKMPIEKSDEEVMDMLKIIANHSPAGVIFGNLQKNRKDKAFVQSEVRQFKVGNFSGKPTYNRSNELIRLSYRHYHERFTIIGCGGVFSAADAYKKITLGASLVQLISGMIFMGPQLISQINLELSELLKKDGFVYISEAIGINNR